MRMTVHHPKGRTLILTSFWYTHYTDVYSSLTYIAVWVSLFIHKLHSAIACRVGGVTFKNVHCIAPQKLDHYVDGSVFIHLPYRSIHLPNVHVIWVHKPCAQTWWCCSTSCSRVQFRKMHMVVYTPRGELWHKQHFGTIAVAICTACWPTLSYGCPHSLSTQIGRSLGA